MEMVFFKEKKEEILDLLTKYNQIKTRNKYFEVQGLCHYVCQKSDIEFVNILLSENIANDSLDKESKAALLFKIIQNLQ